MSTIDTNAYTPHNIKEIRFRIPLYQRPYAWEESQVKQLLRDLNDQFEKKEPNGKYYIGILSIGKTESNDDLYDLIDGQQRITTLILIGRVLSKVDPDWNIFLDDRLDLYGRDEDKKFLKNLDQSSKPNAKMVEAVKTINKFMEGLDNKIAFSKYIFRNAAFFLSEVPKDFTLIEKNLQFVRMNNRGKQLETHEILKIKLASKIINSINLRAYFVKEWNQISQLGCVEDNNPIDTSKSLFELLKTDFNSKEEPKESEIFYQSITSFPEFLLIALARFNYGNDQEPYYLDVSQRKDKLLEEFGFGEKKIAFVWDDNLVSMFLDLIKDQFIIFDNFFIKRDRSETFKFKKVENKEFFKSNDGGGIEKLKVFQSYLNVSRETHLWLKDAFNYFKIDNSAIPENIDASAFLIKLKEIDNETNRNTKSISLNYEGRVRYWFWRLDYYLWEDRSKFFKDNKDMLKVADKFVFRSNRSIEHISPQKPKSNSSVNIGNKLNRFGNMAMISSEQNSTLQNESFEVKRAHVESFVKQSKIGTIESLKLLKIFDYITWDEKNLIVHGNEMVKILINSFPEKYKFIRDCLTENIIVDEK
ncbi:MAG: DUF262 domain-containing HNH endonuclease family protein [Mariniphaga sp.]